MPGFYKHTARTVTFYDGLILAMGDDFRRDILEEGKTLYEADHLGMGDESSTNHHHHHLL